MDVYIIHFEQRYNQMKKYDMILSNSMLGFKLLDTACLNDKRLHGWSCTKLHFSSAKLIFEVKMSGSSQINGK